jgi:hypothetical protein
VFAVELAHQVEHCVGCVAIKVAGGLVGEDACGLCDQRAGDGDALALAAGELAGTMFEAMAEADFVENRGGARQRLPGGLQIGRFKTAGLYGFGHGCEKSACQ